MEQPSSAPTETNPYTAPRADIGTGRDPVANPGTSPETQAVMVFAMALSAGWPLYFGFLLTSPNGRWAMGATLALIAAVVWRLFSQDRDRFDALAKGLLTLGLLSLFPILPMMIGGISISLVNALMRPDTSEPLDPIATALVTILVAGFYVIAGLGIGACFRSLRQRKDRERRRRSGNGSGEAGIE